MSKQLSQQELLNQVMTHMEKLQEQVKSMENKENQIIKLQEQVKSMKDKENQIIKLQEQVKSIEEKQSPPELKITQPKIDKNFSDLSRKEVVKAVMSGTLYQFKDGTNLLGRLCKKNIQTVHIGSGYGYDNTRTTFSVHIQNLHTGNGYGTERTVGYPYINLMYVFLNLFKESILDYFLVPDLDNHCPLYKLLDIGFNGSVLNIISRDLKENKSVYDKLNKHGIIEKLYKEILSLIYSNESLESLQKIALKNEYYEQTESNFLNCIMKKMSQKDLIKLINNKFTKELLLTLFKKNLYKYTPLLYKSSKQTKLLIEIMSEFKNHDELVNFFSKDMSKEEMFNIIVKTNDKTALVAIIAELIPLKDVYKAITK